jgi:hypothetical protein
MEGSEFAIVVILADLPGGQAVGPVVLKTILHQLLQFLDVLSCHVS